MARVGGTVARVGFVGPAAGKHKDSGGEERVRDNHIDLF